MLQEINFGWSSTAVLWWRQLLRFATELKLRRHCISLQRPVRISSLLEHVRFSCSYCLHWHGIWLYIYIHIVGVYIYIAYCMYMYTVCVYIYILHTVCICILYVCIYIYVMYIDVCMYVFMYVCIYVCIYIYMHCCPYIKRINRRFPSDSFGSVEKGVALIYALMGFHARWCPPKL